MSDTAVTELSTELVERTDGLGGVTRIADSVVARIAGMAAREVAGVYDMSHSNIGRAIAGTVQQRIAGGDNRSTGVTVQVGQKETIIELNVIVLYEASIPEVAANIRRNVSDRVTGMTGLRVKEINIMVTDMRFPSEEQAAEPEPKLQ